MRLSEEEATRATKEKKKKAGSYTPRSQPLKLVQMTRRNQAKLFIDAKPPTPTIGEARTSAERPPRRGEAPEIDRA